MLYTVQESPKSDSVPCRLANAHGNYCAAPAARTELAQPESDYTMPADLTDVRTIYNTKVINAVLVVKRLRAYRQPGKRLRTVTQPSDVYAILDWIYNGLDADQEHAVLLVLNHSMEVTGFKVLASGGQAHVSLDSKILFRNALLLGAGSIIFAHNHPTGNPTPSPEDIELTKRVIRSGYELDIPLGDHIIYTDQRCSSIRELRPDIFDYKNQ